MLVVFLITGVFILLGILYIFHLKREIRRIIEWIEHNEHIYSVNVFDKDIENLALSINKRIKEDERKEHQLKKQDKNFKKDGSKFITRFTYSINCYYWLLAVN